MCEPNKFARVAPVEATYNQVIAAENVVAGLQVCVVSGCITRVN